ncbi:hypothetical protein [Solidesulfovibrio sp.]|uniref:hypothetical protein n=1 Tax=Solidesulfovibrio sp. TaxID=2910990 RepID=UPI00262E2BF7|nr:hypothetical protein [Solidesulfovibrio sp.]
MNGKNRLHDIHDPSPGRMPGPSAGRVRMPAYPPGPPGRRARTLPLGDRPAPEKPSGACRGRNDSVDAGLAGQARLAGKATPAAGDAFGLFVSWQYQNKHHLNINYL